MVRHYLVQYVLANLRSIAEVFFEILDGEFRVFLGRVLGKHGKEGPRVLVVRPSHMTPSRPRKVGGVVLGLGPHLDDFPQENVVLFRHNLHDGPGKRVAPGTVAHDSPKQQPVDVLSTVQVAI